MTSRGRQSRRFNGAALFQSGEPTYNMFGTIQANRLQWGRSFSERRTGNTRRTFPRSGSGFNGAALFQSGELRDWPKNTDRPGAASMGPLFFRAENNR